MRRVLAHEFSDKAMRDQEPLIQQYVNMLMQSLHIAAGRGPGNIVQWYEFVTFDIIGMNLVPGKPRSIFYLLMCLGDLTFGKTLGAIKAEFSQWIPFINSIFRAGKRIAAVKYFPHLRPFLSPLLQRSEAYEEVAKISENTRTMVSQRMMAETDRKDFMFYTLRAMDKGEKATMMSDEEIQPTFEVLMVAGSETTATLLSGVTYVYSNPSRATSTIQTSLSGVCRCGFDYTKVDLIRSPF
jgi:cytochrome P450